MYYALITGASSGIGEGLAKYLANKGFNLVLAARNGEKLENIKKEIMTTFPVDVLTYSVDLTEKDGPEKLFVYTVENNIDVRLLINNAGYGDFGLFKDGDLEKYKKMIDLNDKALVSLSYMYIKLFKEVGYGHIVNIASIAGFMPGPYMAVYYASKAFVLNFSLAIREELKNDNIKITTICPGPIDSNFWKVANAEMSPIKRKYFTRSVNQIVNSAGEAILNGKALLIDGVLMKISAFSTRLVSKSTLASITGFVNKKLGNRK